MNNIPDPNKIRNGDYITVPEMLAGKFPDSPQDNNILNLPSNNGDWIRSSFMQTKGAKDQMVLGIATSMEREDCDDHISNPLNPTAPGPHYFAIGAVDGGIEIIFVTVATAVDSAVHPIRTKDNMVEGFHLAYDSTEAFIYEYQKNPEETRAMVIEETIIALEETKSEVECMSDYERGRGAGAIGTGIGAIKKVCQKIFKKNKDSNNLDNNDEEVNNNYIDDIPKSKIVLGKYPDYIKLSDELNAKRFEIPMDIWRKMTPKEQWAANQKFLDRATTRGDDIILSNPVKDINSVSGAFRKELDYLIKKGYQLSDDGTQLILKLE